MRMEQGRWGMVGMIVGLVWMKDFWLMYVGLMGLLIRFIVVDGFEIILLFCGSWDYKIRPIGLVTEWFMD